MRSVYIIFLLAIICQLFPHNYAADNTSDKNNIDRMVNEYMKHLETLVQLLHSDTETQKGTEIIDKGRDAFDKAIAAFPDDTVLAHAHALFAKICFKVGVYDEATNLFDEAIRRASLPLEADNSDPSSLAETKSLVDQLYLERRRSHNQFIGSKVLQWHAANDQEYKGGIPPERSPWQPLSYVELQLGIFPFPHPQTLFEKATLMVLTLDSPEEEIHVKPGDDEAMNATARAWEAYKSYQESQSAAYDAYSHGKKRHLAGGQPCRQKELFVGGTAWSKHAWKSNPFAYDKTKDAGQSDDIYMGIISFQNVLISGRDAVISGASDNCDVFVRHSYINLSNNIPLVTAWETPISDRTTEDNAMWETYIPEGDTRAFGGSIGKDSNGNDVLLIHDPRSSNAYFDSTILLAGYASDNYFHFITEVLPSLVVMRNRIKDILQQQKTESKDVVVVPNLQNEFVEGFFRLLLPEAFDDKGKLSPHIVQWGPWKKSGGAGDSTPFTSTHPIAYTKRLATVMWDQPKVAPPPLSGPAHCLTPKPLLRAMQRVVLKSVDSPTSDMPKKIVYCSRSSSSTRKLLEEEELLSRLEEVASKEGIDLVVFEKQAGTNATSPSPLAAVIDAIELFQSATVVVGVHGASLANIAFARKETTIIELGFGIPQAGHYLHLAKSLELEYVGIRLRQNSRSFGATEVSLPEGGVDEVVNSVIKGLKLSEGTDGRYEL